MTDNPYQQQTDANTSKGWLGDQALDVDLDDMTEFAKNAKAIKENVDGHSGYLRLLASLPMQAVTADGLPEGLYFMDQMSSNYQELTVYMSQLGVALLNIGSAAQTIADSYSSTDGWSAASLDAVKFAYGDPTASRPAGLPSWIGQTFNQVMEQQAKESGSPAGTVWMAAGDRIEADGSITHRSNSPDGRSMEITETHLPYGGGTIYTTRVFSVDGKLLSTSSSREYTYMPDSHSVRTTTTAYDDHGQESSETSTTTSYEPSGSSSEVTTNTVGDKTTTHRVDTSADGSQVVKDINDKGDVVHQVQVGAATPGVSGVGDMPGKDAIDEVTEKYGD